MRRILIAVLIFGLMAMVAPALAHTADDPYRTDLIAGQHTDAGDVLVWNDDEYLYVKFLTADRWCLAETHLAVADALAGIPQTGNGKLQANNGKSKAGNGKQQTGNGNPIPGQFAYGECYDPCVGSDTFMIPLDEVGRGTLYVAAHAVVKKPGGLDGLEGVLPDEVTMRVTFQYLGGPTYLPEVTVTGGTTLDGIYPGWCVNTGTNIERDRDYRAAVYSSYGAIPTGTIDHPENLDLVNWIINQGFVGQTGGNGIYTFGDVQRAIWRLVDDDPEHETYTGYDEGRVQEILAAAYAYGEGFVPGPGDLVAIVLVPEGGQVIIIVVPVPCGEGEETAWGFGTRFVEKGNWGTYFTYTVG
ncbi:hypothetical protein [Methanofollis tationis]|uniref:Uncharacterized protein n=1 Tax=Methanofollis tationis TaxID=81417 RepID=A0A7K4HPY1_9EURY|nr:hypothetical protein [Methanofollis tationis]NVO67324.1 hypothetical protein [Methanofollis tationis]